MVSFSKYSFLMVAFLRVLAGGLILYGILCVFMYGYQDQLLFLRQSISNDRLTHIRTSMPHVAEITLPMNDGTVLHGWVVNDQQDDPAAARQTVLYFGGNAEEVSHMIEEASAFPHWSFVLINYRGYGRSQGSPSEEKLYEDALGIYDALTDLGKVDSAGVILMGRSLGTGVATHLARHRQVQGAVLISPYDSMARVAQEAYPFLPANLLLRHRFNAAADAASIQIPLYVLIALEDRVISPRRSRKLLEAWGGEVYLTEVARAGHNNLTGTTEYAVFLAESLAALQPGQ